MAYYIFTTFPGDPASGSSPRERAIRLLNAGMWGLGPDQPHRDALTRGDLVLIYLAAPEREFIGRAQLASAARDWTRAEAQVYPGDSRSGVVLCQVEEWNPPVPVAAVLARIDSAEDAGPTSRRASFASPQTNIRRLVRSRQGAHESAVVIEPLRRRHAADTPRP